MAETLRDPAGVARIAPTGTILVDNSTPEFATWLVAQRDVVEGIIKDARIKLD